MAVVQYTFTHKQYTEYRERNIHNNKKKLGTACCAPSMRVIPWHLPYNWGKSTENPVSTEKPQSTEKTLKKFLLFLKNLFKVSFQVQVLASFRKIPSLKHVRYSKITSTKYRSFCVTTFSASLRNLTAFKHHSRDSSCYVSRILAPPRLQKHTDLRAQEFAHCPDL
jgi:hypothetical protein